jgi:hypothetical protein
MSKAGIAETRNPIAVRFINTVSGGEIRLYDLFIRIYDGEATGIGEIKEIVSYKPYQTETAFVVHGDIASLKVFNLSGQLVSQSAWSQTVTIAGLNKGVYILQVVNKNGNRDTLKVIKK